MDSEPGIITRLCLKDLAIEATSGQKQQAFAALLDTLYRHTGVGILGTIISVAILAYVNYFQVNPRALTCWIALMTAAVLFRFFAARHYKKRIAHQPPEKLYGLMLASIIVIGCCWATAVVFLVPADASMAHALFVVIVLCGMSAGALGALAVPLSAYLGFSLPVLLAISVRFAVLDHPLHLAVSLVTLLFLGLTVNIALRINRNSYRLHLMNIVFEEKVAERTQSLHKVNHELESRVQEVQKARQMLEQERDRLETITGNIGAGLAVISRDYKILWANKVLKEIFDDRCEGQPCFYNFKREKGICPECGVSRIFETGAEQVIHEQAGSDNRGNNLWFQIVATPIKDSNGNVTAALSLVLPITEKKQDEAMRQRMARELEQVRKIEAIATLAGGIAHQFNNALTAVVGNLELLQLDYAHDENLATYIKPIFDSAAKMTQWTRQLLAYAEGGKYRPQTVSLVVFIKETLPLLRHSLPPHIEMIADLENIECPVHIDLAQMQMVLSSIVANAAEAIKRQGTIRLTCRDGESDKGPLPGLDLDRYVCLSVIDNGQGMDEETRKRVFEPFYTTKFYGRGLGMAAVYGIIKNHGGYITIESEKGKGTAVHLFLPRASEQEPGETLEPAMTGSGTILLIEDEKPVREINQAILERLGYKVITAENGSQALDLCSDDNEHFDLALLDLKLPDIDGAALFPKLREQRPEMKVIVCSGYSLDGATQAILDAGAEDFIQKPFSMADIAAKIEKVLKNMP